MSLFKVADGLFPGICPGPVPPFFLARIPLHGAKLDYDRWHLDFASLGPQLDRFAVELARRAPIPGMIAKFATSYSRQS